MLCFSHSHFSQWTLTAHVLAWLGVLYVFKATYLSHKHTFHIESRLLAAAGQVRREIYI